MRWGVDFVFHAAALKQVPSCEFYPMEAVKTNVLGTENVMNAAIGMRRQPRRAAFSTDKAVYPINAMGMSKALMEKVLSPRRACGVRATTVLRHALWQRHGLTGLGDSALRRQIKAGKPLTITDPKMTRFLMSLEDSVDLVLACLQERRAGGHFCAEGTGLHHRRPGERVAAHL